MMRLVVFSVLKKTGHWICLTDVLAGENHSERKEIGSSAKRLLQLLDAADTESVEGELNQVEINNQPTGTNNSLLNGSELEWNELSSQEELHHVYQRLQALEADGEFLKHCLLLHEERR
ncbi:myosin-binding protein 3 [Forsythia ovata]|uniref:Myosin-binding protein 3 n=1 Tax=Forsythia ovata TaxID=205694 RepID=A0ABD1UB49_9LAMI